MVTQIAKEFVLPLLLSVLTLFAGRIASELKDIGEQLTVVRISLATMSEKVLHNDNRINQLQQKFEGVECLSKRGRVVK